MNPRPEILTAESPPELLLNPSPTIGYVPPAAWEKTVSKKYNSRYNFASVKTCLKNQKK
jgi:hypothetical protein